MGVGGDIMDAPSLPGAFFPLGVLAFLLPFFLLVGEEEGGMTTGGGFMDMELIDMGMPGAPGATDDEGGME